MKYILLLFLLLQGCIGASFISSHEGVKLDNPNNSYKRPPNFRSFSHGYSSGNDSDPGLPITLDNGNLIVIANCLNERMVSFFPAFIIPLPPIIPLFGKGDGVLTDKLKFTLDGIDRNEYKVQSIRLNNKLLTPTLTNEYTYTFDLSCKELPESSQLILNSHNNEILINVKYFKAYNFSWFWLSS